MRRYSEVFSDSRSTLLARIARALLALEDILEELADKYVVSGVEVEPEPVDLDYLETSDAPLRFLVCVGRRLGVVEEGDGYVIEAVEHAGNNLLLLYDELARYFGHYARRRLANFVRVGGGTEYFMAVMDSGEVFLAEGEYGRVSIPAVQGMVLTAHTHPSNVYWFSIPDLRTALDFFSHRGLATAVVTGAGATVLYRRGFFTLEDYETMLRAVKSGDERVVLELVRRAPNIRVEFV